MVLVQVLLHCQARSGGGGCWPPLLVERRTEEVVNDEVGMRFSASWASCRPVI